MVLLGGCVVVLSVAVARALSCVCSSLECDPLTEEDCPGGLTLDPCKYVPQMEKEKLALNFHVKNNILTGNFVIIQLVNLINSQFVPHLENKKRYINKGSHSSLARKCRYEIVGRPEIVVGAMK